MYFLFSQKYSFKTLNYFKNGIDLERALSFKCAKSMKSRSVMKVTEKLIPYIKYIEKEEHIVVLKQTMQSKYISRWKKSDSEKELQFDFF